MILIVTHDNSDFDALASAYLLSVIYKGALILRPLSMEEEVERFIKDSNIHIPFIEDPDPEEVKKIIFCDTDMDEGLLEKFGIKAGIMVLDHHKNNKFGSNISLLFNKYMNRLKNINPQEALFFLLGIYQDTGGLTYRSTKKPDFEAAGFFLKFKPSIERIPYYINYSFLDDDSLQISADLIGNATVYGPKPFRIMITHYEAKKYYHGYSVLLNHIMNIKKVNAIFAVFIFKRKTIVTARSADENINVNAILNKIKKGKGHILASSRGFNDISPKTILQILRDLISGFLFKKRVSFFIKRVDWKRFVIIKPEDILINSNATLWDYLDLISKNENTTILYRNKFLSHEIRKEILSPHLINSPLIPPYQRKKHKISQSLRKYIRTLFKKRSRIIEDISVRAQKNNCRAFIVGGIARDIIISYFTGRKNLYLDEIDLVIEGMDAIEFALDIKSDLPKTGIHVYNEFNTATLKFDKFTLDLATARKEKYSHSGALPTVISANIQDDLSRRDFTVNSIAISINPDDFGAVHDFFGGVNDIKEKKLRVLHQKSFFDDPTRVLRMIRLSQELDFGIEIRTEELMRFSLIFGILQNIKGHRLTRELSYTFNGSNPVESIEKLHYYGILREIFGIEDVNIAEIKNLHTTIKWFTLLHSEIELKKNLIYFGYFFRKRSGFDSAYFSFNKKDKRIITEMISLKIPALLRPRSKFSTFHGIFKNYSYETMILCVILLPEIIRERYIKYILKLIEYKPLITGDTIKKYGFRHEKIGHMLEKIKMACLDGIINNEKEALDHLNDLTGT